MCNQCYGSIVFATVLILLSLVSCGMQRLLAAWGQRGSWMPSNFLQTSSLKNFYIHLAKFLMTFLVYHLNFSNLSPKISYDLFFFLAIFPNFALFRIGF